MAVARVASVPPSLKSSIERRVMRDAHYQQEKNSKMHSQIDMPLSVFEPESKKIKLECVSSTAKEREKALLN